MTFFRFLGRKGLHHKRGILVLIYGHYFKAIKVKETFKTKINIFLHHINGFLGGMDCIVNFTFRF